MSKQRLPSLNLLRVFEAAGRHLSFKKAAEELFVSQPAVSHQVRTLEEQLQTELFVRLNRKIELTPLGEEYFHHVQDALARLKKATQDLEANRDRPLFVINTLPNLVSLLLVPYIDSFQKTQPHFNIRLDSDTSRVDFKTGKLDVALRHQMGEEPDLIYIPLTKVSITPVCAPDYFEQHPEVDIHTFKNARIIKETIGPNTWRKWLTDWGYTVPEGNEMLLNTFQSSMEAVKASAGIAMGYKPTIGPMLKRGEIVAPFPDKVSELGDLYMVYHQRDINKPVMKDFEAWLKHVVQTEWSED